jgi:guanine deaminase
LTLFLFLDKILIAMDDTYFMRLAIEKAKEGIATGQSPFGCCIVKGKKVISCRHNTVWSTIDSTAHAEINAIRDACRKLKTIHLTGCTLYSTCEPCPMCFSAAHWARIPRIVFGAFIKDARTAGFNELPIWVHTMKKLGNNNARIISELMREECRELFRVWREDYRGKHY